MHPPDVMPVATSLALNGSDRSPAREGGRRRTLGWALRQPPVQVEVPRKEGTEQGKAETPEAPPTPTDTVELPIQLVTMLSDE